MDALGISSLGSKLRFQPLFEVFDRLTNIAGRFRAFRIGFRSASTKYRGGRQGWRPASLCAT